MKIFLLVGMPGCGKTYLGNQLSKELDAVFIDDVNLNNGIQQVKNAVAGHVSPLVVADVFLCREKEREAAKKILEDRGYDIEWIFFENDPEKCLKNVRRRDDGRKVEGLIRQLTKEYTIPEGAEVRQIYEN